MKHARLESGELNPEFIAAVRNELQSHRPGDWVRISTLGYGEQVAAFGPTARDMHDACWAIFDAGGVASVVDGSVRRTG